MSTATRTPLLDIQNLRVLFQVRGKRLPAVDGVNLTVQSGEIVGVVGESGSGKSVMSQSILRLRDYEAAIEYEGQIIFENQDLLRLPLSKLHNIRGNRISVIFQDPMTSLSPVHTVKKQLIEVLKLHKGLSQGAAWTRAVELLKLTGIPNPEGCMRKYPFELSGGMQQRVMIAMALACEPGLLIADEPTTALDVTIQEQILNLIVALNQSLGMSVLFITHDLGAVAQLCHRVCVMYLGQIVETAPTETLFHKPLHPYTQGLLACIPQLDTRRDTPLSTIPGTVPPLSQIPEGCHFCTRCAYATDLCRKKVPVEQEIESGHRVRCWKFSRDERQQEAAE